MKSLNELSRKELINLYLENLLGSKKYVTQEIKKTLLNLGFKEKKLGGRFECEINSKEIKTDFLGYDFAIGLAARCEHCKSKRRFTAMVIKLIDYELSNIDCKL